MQSIKFLFVIFAMAAVMSLLTFSSAQSRRPDSRQGAQQFGKADMPPPPHHPPGAFHPRVFEQLNLTDAQQTQIREIMDNSRTAAEQYHEKMRENHDAMKSVVEAGTFDESAARELLGKESAVKIELDLIHLRTDNQIYNLLTAEQKARFETLKNECPEPPHGGRRPEFRQ